GPRSGQPTLPPFAAGGAGLSRRAADRRRQGSITRGAGCLPDAGNRAALPDLAGEARRGSVSSRGSGAVAIESSRRRAASVAVRPRRGPPLRPALPPHSPPEETAG